MTTMTLRSHQRDTAVKVLARAFVTNPLHVAVFGRDAVQANETFFRVGLRTMAGEKRVVVDGERILGVVHWVESPKCQLTSTHTLANALPLVWGCGVRSTMKIAQWMSVWAKHDPGERHLHFGPIAVEPDAQGCGIGGLLMKQFCGRLDDSSMVGYLETDRAENVRFYRRFGFQVTRTWPVHGIVNYFMRREAKP